MPGRTWTSTCSVIVYPRPDPAAGAPPVHSRSDTEEGIPWRATRSSTCCAPTARAMRPSSSRGRRSRASRACSPRSSAPWPRASSGSTGTRPARPTSRRGCRCSRTGSSRPNASGRATGCAFPARVIPPGAGRCASRALPRSARALRADEAAASPPRTSTCAT